LWNTEASAGKINLVFCSTCRPGFCCPFDLKRQGRAEEHIALLLLSPKLIRKRLAILRAMLKKNPQRRVGLPKEAEKFFS